MVYGAKQHCLDDVNDTDGGNANTILVDVSESASLTNEFVDSVIMTGSISGSVQEDAYNDNVVGDIDLEGVALILKDPNRNDVTTTATDCLGDFIFNNVP